MSIARFSISLLVCVVPVQGIVIRQFQPPACERCAGHRGITLESAPGQSVVAVADGVVEFAGSVGGRLYVVQRVSPDVRVNYGDLVSIDAAKGDRVGGGDALGVSGVTTYLSVRVGEMHVEPLRALGLGRARLVSVTE